MGELDGKIALITGAGRGQGRSHALHLAAAGADIIAIDVCKDVDGIPYPMSTHSDLAETQKLVEALGCRVVARQADVADAAQLEAAVAAGVEELGGLDIVIANAGVFPISQERRPADSRVRTRLWKQTLDTNITGTWNTLEATTPILVEQGRGGAVVITGSIAAAKGLTYRDVGLTAYVVSKHALTGLVRGYAKDLAEFNIRVNAVEPTGVHTMMIDNPVVGARIDDDPAMAVLFQNALPVDAIDVADVSRAVLYLVGESGRYITGSRLVIDAGHNLVATG
jgi:SDR family mycofactocin-dependent oxidoreductase